MALLDPPTAPPGPAALRGSPEPVPISHPGGGEPAQVAGRSRPRRVTGSPATRRAAADGVRAIAPVLAGVAPFAVVIGATIGAARVDHLAAWAGSFLIVAGTAQLTAVQLLDQGAGPVAAVAAVVVVNARFALYSAGLARWFAGEPLRRRLLLAFPLVDQLYAVCSARFDGDRPTPPAERRAFYAAAAVVLVVGWTAVQGVAVGLAGSLPDGTWLRPAAPLALVGVLAAGRHDRTTVTAALVAGAAALLVGSAGGAAAHQIGPVLAIAAGLGAGMVAGRRRP